MANKIIIGILVVLMILMGGSGYYSYILTQQIDSLNNRLTISEMEQTARNDAVNNELTTLRAETLSSINALQGKITGTLSEIHTLKEELKEEIGATQNHVASLEDKIDGVTSQVGILEDRITELSSSVIDASKVYQRVSQATVRISNGQNTIGSGFVLDTEAHVVTAYHVVESLTQIYAILHDGRIYKATVIGFCPYSDIAVLKLEGNPAIEPPPLADSSLVRIGESVVALGSPLDLRDTLTAGIISQVNQYAEIQSDTQSRWVANLIQFDAAVNPGNSGCPLANADGEVIGVVIARINADQGDGISWAVSSNKAKRVATALIAHGSFDYPWIGVVVTNLTPQLVQERALKTANGVLVAGISATSPAEAAGIKAYDIIVSIDDILVKDSADVTSYLGEFKSPGDLVTISLIRDDTQLELSFEIGKRQQ